MKPGLLLAALLPAFSAVGDELPVLRRSFSEPASPVPPFPDGRFEPRCGETLSWIGGTEVHELDRHGLVEAGLHLAWPDRALRWRNLAWQGDTVHVQARPLHYYTERGDTQPGSIPDSRERTEPGVVFLAFGKMESLEGIGRLPRFVKAYGSLLDDLAALTPRLVLVEPPPFFESGPAAALAGPRNGVLAEYVSAIADLAAERGLFFLRHGAVEWTAAMSDNGVHLNAAGHRAWADALLARLGGGKGDPSAALLDAVARKNLFWQQYYRPTNWAFLFGDRQHVPASRDVEKREERWFVREIDALPALLAEAERDLHRYAKEAAR